MVFWLEKMYDKSALGAKYTKSADWRSNTRLDDFDCGAV